MKETLLPLPPLPNLHVTEPVPRILFNNGFFTVDGPMVSIHISLCLIVSFIGGILVIPHIETHFIFCFFLFMETGIILSVLCRLKCCLALCLMYKFTLWIITLICAVAWSFLLMTQWEMKHFLAESFAQSLKNVTAEDLAIPMVVGVWIISICFLFTILFSFLHLASLFETMKRLDKISLIKMHKRRQSLPPPPRVIMASSLCEEGDRLSNFSDSV